MFGTQRFADNIGMAEHEKKSDARMGYQTILTDLVGLYPALTHNPPAWRAGYAGVAHLAHGWFVRCLRSIQAILVLDEGGYSEEASPLRRSVIEHCVALRWLRAKGDTMLDTVARGHAATAEQLREAVSAAGWTSIDVNIFDEVIKEIDPSTRDSHDDYLLNFNRRFQEFGDVHTLPIYRSECAKTHPSYESAASYLDEEGDLTSRPREYVWQVPFCATHLLEATVCINDIFDPKPWDAVLDPLLDRYCAVTNEVRAQDGLEPIEWSAV
jgi:hypothetical protein